MRPLPALCATFLLAVPALPCSAFLVVGAGAVFFGNNEDFWNPETRVWFVPAEEGRHGVMYLGFDNGFPQGGLNDAGLAFDGFATGPRPMQEQEGKPTFEGNPISEVMETCATVEEAIAFLEGIDLRPLLTPAMLFFADASGDSVIVEGDEFVRKQDDFQVVTNFYQSAQDDDLAQCPRYAAAVRVLRARKDTSLDVCTRALSAAAQRGRRVATLYSNVFDLKTRTVRLYLFHDFEHPVVLDLDQELAKGKRTLKLPELFPANAAFEKYTAYQNQTLEQRVAARRGPELPTETLEACAGEYDLELRGETHRVTIRREKEHLVAASEDLFKGSDGALELHSATSSEFFAISLQGEVTIRFGYDDGGAVTGFTIAASGLELEAKRVTGRLPQCP
jgi:hypothetical protein